MGSCASPALALQKPLDIFLAFLYREEWRSGSSGALLRRRPLRTVQASFPAHGSSLLTAPGTRGPGNHVNGCLGNTRLQPHDLLGNMGPVGLVPGHVAGGGAPDSEAAGATGAESVICLPPELRFIRLSCHRRPRGSQPAFASGDVSTRIHPATGWHSLCPRSFTRCTISLPCGRPAVAGDASGLPCSVNITTSGVGPASTPEVFESACAVCRAAHPTTYRVGSSLSASLACLW